VEEAVGDLSAGQDGVDADLATPGVERPRWPAIATGW
jgi:hypothetical protein